MPLFKRRTLRSSTGCKRCKHTLTDKQVNSNQTTSTSQKSKQICVHLVTHVRAKFWLTDRTVIIIMAADSERADTDFKHVLWFIMSVMLTTSERNAYRLTIHTQKQLENGDVYKVLHLITPLETELWFLCVMQLQYSGNLQMLLMPKPANLEPSFIASRHINDSEAVGVGLFPSVSCHFKSWTKQLFWFN